MSLPTTLPSMPSVGQEGERLRILLAKCMADEEYRLARGVSAGYNELVTFITFAQTQLNTFINGARAITNVVVSGNNIITAAEAAAVVPIVVSKTAGWANGLAINAYIYNAAGVQQGAVISGVVAAGNVTLNMPSAQALALAIGSYTCRVEIADPTYNAKSTFAIAFTRTA